MGTFLVKKTNTGYTFDLFARNGAIIASSEVHANETSCLRGVASVANDASIANLEDLTEEPVMTADNPKFEITLDQSGEYQFRLKARNGDVIIASEGYKTKISCLNGIESVRKETIEAKLERNYTR